MDSTDVEVLVHVLVCVLHCNPKPVTVVLMLQEGFWELTNELGQLINLNVDVFANVFLKDKGIHSLGEISEENWLFIPD